MKLAIGKSFVKSEYALLNSKWYYVKAKPLTDAKALLMEEMREAVEEMKLIKAGKKTACKAEDFLNEL